MLSIWLRLLLEIRACSPMCLLRCSHEHAQAFLARNLASAVADAFRAAHRRRVIVLRPDSVSAEAG